MLMKNKFYLNPNKLIIGVMVAAIVLLFGCSYAFYKLTVTGEKEITLTSGELQITFDDTSSSAITLSNAEPISDEEGLSTTAYNFTIKNTGNIDSDYAIYLDDVTISDAPRMPDKYIKFSLTKGGEVANPSLLTVHTAFTNDAGVITRSIGTGTLSPALEENYTLHIWIADSADNAVMGTKFKVRLRIEATQKINDEDTTTTSNGLNINE